MRALAPSSLVDNALVRAIAGIAMLARGVVQLALRRIYPGMRSVCWVHRVSGRPFLRRIALRYVSRQVLRAQREGSNPILSSFLEGSAQTAIDRYSLGGTGDLDLFRDVMILKSPNGREKGVILLKYTETFDAFLAYFDLARVTARYRLVLEPSWAGYCDPSVLMYVLPDDPVTIQCFTEDDCRFIRELDSNLRPVRLGPADWTPVDRFSNLPSHDREYDVIMIANWGRHKQHRQLFRALREVPRPIRVLLVGFPWSDRTKEDIVRESRIVAPEVSVEIEERLTHTEVADRLWRSKLLVFLSKKEGDNKAVVEGFFADVPAIVYEDSVGGARNRINEETGILSSYDDLSRNIFWLLDHRREFSPRAWALANTGSVRATGLLEEHLQQLASEQDQPFSAGIAHKANAPNLAHMDTASRDDFEEDYERLLSFRRS